MVHIRQSRPDYGIGFQLKVLIFFQVVPSSLGMTSPDSRTRIRQSPLPSEEGTCF